MTAQSIVEEQMPGSAVRVPEGEDQEAYAILKALVVMLVAMWIGGLISAWIDRTWPGSGWRCRPTSARCSWQQRSGTSTTSPGSLVFRSRSIDDLGNVALSLFLVLALMTLRLWEIVDLAVPLVIILGCRLCPWRRWPLAGVPAMGRDYEAAVIASGYCGFMLGTTANAMANMEALVERYGPAPRAFLVVPMVGAFFIDFTNALVITGFLNLLR